MNEQQCSSISNITTGLQQGSEPHIKDEAQCTSAPKAENDDTQMDMRDEPSFGLEAESPKGPFPLGQVSQVSASPSFDPTWWTARLFVSHLPLSMTGADLIKKFEGFPGFKYATVHPFRADRNSYLTGHVQFKDNVTQRAALRQFSKFDGFKVFPYQKNYNQSKKQGLPTKEEGEDEDLPLEQVEKRQVHPLLRNSRHRANITDRLIRSIGAIAGEMIVKLMRDIDERFSLETREQRVVRLMQIQFQNLELHFADVQALRNDFATVEVSSWVHHSATESNYLSRHWQRRT
jgi:hypothetical protein